jgi:hypothetical protein
MRAKATKGPDACAAAGLPIGLTMPTLADPGYDGAGPLIRA